MEDSSPSIVEGSDDDIQILDDSKSKKRKTSDVWNHFTEEKQPNKDGKLTVKCNHCDQAYTYEGTKHGTSTFSRHLKVCKKKPMFGNVSFMLRDHDGKLKARSKVIDQKICREWMTKITVAHDLPLNWVEFENVRGYLLYLNSDVKFISRNTLASDIMNMYNIEKEKLSIRLNSISGMLCLTSDVWTACTNSGYICLTAHYVDDKWKLNSRILAFCSMPPPHSGPELAQKIFDILVDWKIEKKVFSLTLDNASANNAMVQILKTRLQIQNSLLCKGEYFHVRCCAQILNLIVQEGLKVACDAIEKIRGSVKYVKASEGRLLMFKECAKKYGVEFTSSLCLDVPTRWNSTYLMLCSGIKYRHVFDMFRYEDLNYKQCPTEEEWERGEVMLRFLKPFYNITTLISGSSYPTSNLYFMEIWKIASLLNRMSESQDEVIKSMSLKMKLKFDKYWKEYSEILSVGAVLDPRMKLKVLEYFYSRIDPLSSKDKTLRLKMKLYTLYDEYKKRGVGKSLFKVPQASSGSSSSQVRELEFMDKEELRGEEMNRALNWEEDDLAIYKNLVGATSEEKSPLDVYLEEGVMAENVELDLLKYWRENASRFGELSTMACDVLSIPITTVASESSFSIGAHVLNKYRNRLLPEKVQALICLRNWLRGYSNDDEDYELDVDDPVDASNVIDVEERHSNA